LQKKSFNNETSKSWGPFQKTHITVVVSPDPLYPAPSASSATKIPKITGEDPDAPEPTADRNIQIEYCSD